MSLIHIDSYRFAASGGGGGATDPDFSSVSLLLHGDGVNGGNNTTFVDSSTNNHAITVYGNTQQVGVSPFGSGGSGAFDGSGDYLRIPSDTSLEFGTSDFTVEFWWQRTSSASGGLVDLGLNYGGIGIYQSTSLFVRIARSDVYIGSLFPENQWVHVALSRAGTSLRLFFDGIQQGSTITNSTNLVNTFGVAAVGAFINNGIYYPTPAAYVDDLRITKGVARYTSNFTPPTAPLTADANTSLLLRFDNVDIIDSSPSPKAITAYGNAQISTAQSKFGGSSLVLDGSGDYIQPAASTDYNFSSGDFTIEAWIYPLALGGPRVIADARNGDNTGNYFLGINLSSKLYFIAGTILTGATTIATNSWTHVAVSRNSGTTKLFVNGVQDAVATLTGAIDQQAALAIGGGRSTMGSSVTGYYFNGYIDDLRITKGVARYTANFTPPTAPFPDA